MKNSSAATDIFSLSPLTQFGRQNFVKHLFLTIKNLLSTYKEHIELCIATLLVGSIFLVSIFLFFTQLAKYGW